MPKAIRDPWNFQSSEAHAITVLFDSSAIAKESRNLQHPSAKRRQTVFFFSFFYEGIKILQVKMFVHDYVQDPNQESCLQLEFSML